MVNSHWLNFICHRNSLETRKDKSGDSGDLFQKKLYKAGIKHQKKLRISREIKSGICLTLELIINKMECKQHKLTQIS